MLIRKFKEKAPVAAIKISPHNHDSAYPLQKLNSNEGFSVWQEQKNSGKDSGKFIEAGADPVFYIETSDLHLYDAFTYTAALFSSRLIICESGGLARYVKPGLLVYIQSPDGQLSAKKEQVKSMADLIISPEDVLSLSGELESDQGIWKLS